MAGDRVNFQQRKPGTLKRALTEGNCTSRPTSKRFSPIALPERMPGTPIRGESGCQAPPINAPTPASESVKSL